MQRYPPVCRMCRVRSPRRHLSIVCSWHMLDQLSALTSGSLSHHRSKRRQQWQPPGLQLSSQCTTPAMQAPCSGCLCVAVLAWHSIATGCGCAEGGRRVGQGALGMTCLGGERGRAGVVNYINNRANRQAEGGESARAEAGVGQQPCGHGSWSGGGSVASQQLGVWRAERGMQRSLGERQRSTEQGGTAGKNTARREKSNRKWHTVRRQTPAASSACGLGTAWL